MKKAVLLCMVFLSFFFVAMAQEKKDDEDEKQYKNTVRFNLTHPMIFGLSSLIFGYERILKNNQSFSINIGHASFPRFGYLSSDSLKHNENLNGKGFNFSVDYRFYLPRQNKYAPPRGVYVGPYYAYNYFERSNSWTLKSTEGGTPKNVDTKTSLSIHTVGFELGYQFVFWDRLTLDFVAVGPGVGAYNLKSSFGTNLSDADKQKFLESLNQAFEEKFPGYSVTIDDAEFQKKGTSSSVRLGYRYMALIGFRF